MKMFNLQSKSKLFDQLLNKNKNKKNSNPPIMPYALNTENYDDDDKVIISEKLNDDDLLDIEPHIEENIPKQTQITQTDEGEDEGEGKQQSMDCVDDLSFNDKQIEKFNIINDRIKFDPHEDIDNSINHNKIINPENSNIIFNTFLGHNQNQDQERREINTIYKKLSINEILKPDKKSTDEFKINSEGELGYVYANSNDTEQIPSKKLGRYDFSDDEEEGQRIVERFRNGLCEEDGQFFLNFGNKNNNPSYLPSTEQKISFKLLNEENEKLKDKLPNKKSSTTMSRNKSTKTITYKDNNGLIKLISNPNPSEAKINFNIKGTNYKFPKYKTKNMVRDYSKYDIQKLSYDINKEYSSLKIPKEKKFDERMKFYALKKQIKEKKIYQLLDAYKIKIPEKEKLSTFNNLLEDTNRRLEAKRKIKELKVLEENEKYFKSLEERYKAKDTDENINLYENSNRTTKTKSNTGKKYCHEKWEEIYRERFKEKEYLRTEKLKFLKFEKERQRIKEEEEIIRKVRNKTKIVPQRYLESSVDRLHNSNYSKRMLQNQNTVRSLKNSKTSKNCFTINLNKSKSYTQKYHDDELIDRLKRNKSNSYMKYNFKDFNSIESNSNYNNTRENESRELINSPKIRESFNLKSSKKSNKYSHINSRVYDEIREPPLLKYNDKPSSLNVFKREFSNPKLRNELDIYKLNLQLNHQNTNTSASKSSPGNYSTYQYRKKDFKVYVPPSYNSELDLDFYKQNNFSELKFDEIKDYRNYHFDQDYYSVNAIKEIGINK